MKIWVLSHYKLFAITGMVLSLMFFVYMLTSSLELKKLQKLNADLPEMQVPMYGDYRVIPK